MRTIIKFFLVFGGIVILAVFNLGFSYILPYPWSKINIIFAVMVLLLVWWESGSVVWITFFSSFIIELFAVTPFGVILFAATTSILVSYWFYWHIFTNKTWYTAVSLSLFAISFYRFTYVIILLILSVFNIGPELPGISFYQILFWELVLTAVFVLALYLLLFLIKKTKKEKIYNFLNKSF